MYITGQVAPEWRAPEPQEGRAVAYRYQVVSVGWWRGKIKRWNTTFHYSVSNGADVLASIVSKASWPNPGDVAGACSGGVASVSVYAPTGGAPIDQRTYFDWQTPSTWIPFQGTGWAGVAPTTPLDASGESAAVIVGNMAALSATGKPVTTRKYLHAVPSRTAAAYTDPDISAAIQAQLAALFPASIMANPAGVTPESVVCEPYYLNHQRVRGRRRTVTQVAAQSFSAGVVTGTAAAGGGSGSSQFQ